MYNNKKMGFENLKGHLRLKKVGLRFSLSNSWVEGLSQSLVYGLGFRISGLEN